MKTIEVTLWFVLYFEEVTFARIHGVGWVGFEKLEKKVRRRAITTAKSSRRPTLEKLHLKYDTLSANVAKSFPKLAKSESGQIVLEKVKLTYFNVYLSHTM